MVNHIEDYTGRQFGNYRLIRLLGEGGFAQVYLGEHIHLGRQAAIKVLHTRLTPDEVEDFLTEARIIAHLAHRHIVRVLEFGLEGNTPFFVMNYAPNGNLRQRHPKRRVLPLTTIITYIKQVAEALQYAHDENLVHRDIKPENMLMGRDHEILLSDFGIARVIQGSRILSTQKIVGTVTYMAPEQVQGKPCMASDQYGLGIIVYEWLSGTPPFQGSFIEIATQHVLAPPPPLHEKMVSTFIPAVEEVVLRALAKDPKERFPSVQAFAVELEQASKATPSHAFVSPVLAVQPHPTSQPTKGDTLTSQSSELFKRGISRREILIGLGSLAVGGGGMTWLLLSQKLHPFGLNSTSTYTPSATLLINVPHCTSTGQLCDPPFTTNVETGSILKIEYINTNCSSLRLHVIVDGKEVATTGFLRWSLGWSGREPRQFATLPLSTGILDLSPVTSGQHVLALQAEGQVSGCNTNGIGGWVGILSIYT